MNVVLDANILISATQFGGKPQRVLDLIDNDQLHAYISDEIAQETLNNLKKKFGVGLAEVQTIESVLAVLTKKVAVKSLAGPFRDPKDNHVLAITHEVRVDYIISGDKDLLTLKKYNGVPIVTPSQFLEQFES